MKLTLTKSDPADHLVRPAEYHEATMARFRRRRAKERRRKEAEKGLRVKPFAGLAELVKGS